MLLPPAARELSYPPQKLESPGSCRDDHLGLLLLLWLLRWSCCRRRRSVLVPETAARAASRLSLRSRSLLLEPAVWKPSQPPRSLARLLLLLLCCSWLDFCGLAFLPFLLVWPRYSRYLGQSSNSMDQQLSAGIRQKVRQSSLSNNKLPVRSQALAAVGGFLH